MQDAIRFYDRALARMTRREWLNAAWALGAAAIAQPFLSDRVIAQPVFRAYPFPLGAASGEPWPDGVVLWTRLAPDPLNGGGMPMARVEVGWEIATDPNLRTIVTKGSAVARPELGHSVHVEVNGLQPGREYFYRFHCGGEASPVGRTKTAPADGATVDQIRFGVCGCSHYEQGYFTAYGHLAAERLDFVFHTGDYIYEDRADGGRNARVRQHNGDEIFSLVDYRNRYALYKLDADLRAAHLSAPFIMSWDDHEVDNDHAGEHDEHGTPPEVFLLRRAAAYQAYYETMPLRASSLPNGPRMKLYRRLRFGTLIDMSVLDTRQYRSDQVCGGIAAGCPDARDAARSILGAEQEKWLFDNLASSRAKWTVVAQQVPTYVRDARINPTGVSMDKWDGYVSSRQRLYGHLRDAKPPNPIVLSGDVHTHWGADLKMDFGNPKSDTVAVEFTNTSITSGGDGRDTAPDWDQIHANNPQILFHSARRGYLSCTATAASMRADFKVVEGVSTLNAPSRTGGSVLVQAGRPGGTLA